MEESRVAFQGPGPFHISGVQRATANALTSSANVILYALLNRLGFDYQEAVSFQLLPAQAQQLATQLLDAANQIEKHSNR